MNAAAGGLSLAAVVVACPQCGQPMDACELEGHYGQQVATDVCPRCRLVWFDAFESVRLSGLGWVGLLRRMQAAMGEPAAPMPPRLDCPRCQGPLKPVHNLTRFGRFAALECGRQHGHLHSFSLLLAERGLVRPLGRSDLQGLAEEGRSPCCFNCGAALEGGTATCRYCESPLVVIDMPRLLAALLMRHAEPLPAASAERVAWPCRACGTPLEPTRSAACETCHHPVVVPSVLDLRPLLDQAEPLLRAALPRQARPHGEKLKAMRGDHRATAAHGVWRHALDLFHDGRGGGDNSWANWIGAALLAALLWWIWG